MFKDVLKYHCFRACGLPPKDLARRLEEVEKRPPQASEICETEAFLQFTEAAKPWEGQDVGRAVYSI